MVSCWMRSPGFHTLRTRQAQQHTHSVGILQQFVLFPVLPDDERARGGIANHTPEKLERCREDQRCPSSFVKDSSGGLMYNIYHPYRPIPTQRQVLMLRTVQGTVEIPKMRLVDRTVEVQVVIQKQVETRREPQRQVCSSRQMPCCNRV